MPPWKHRVAANSKTLAASDLFVDSAAILPVRLSADNSEDGCSDECVSARIEIGVFVAVKIFFFTSCAVPVALAVVSLAGSNRAADTEPQKEH